MDESDEEGYDWSAYHHNAISYAGHRCCEEGSILFRYHNIPRSTHFFSCLVVVCNTMVIVLCMESNCGCRGSDAEVEELLMSSTKHLGAEEGTSQKYFGDVSNCNLKSFYSNNISHCLGRQIRG